MCDTAFKTAGTVTLLLKDQFIYYIILSYLIDASVVVFCGIIYTLLY